MRPDTICAIATGEPSRFAALALIRISGPKALSAVRQFARLPSLPPPRRALLRVFRERGRPLDQALFTYFPKPASFTGEDMVEITCHGGLFAPKRLMSALLKSGLRLAEPGEFSLRAFGSGKLDLTQAEGLLRLIESSSDRAAAAALAALRGGLSKPLKEMRRRLLSLLAHIEAEIDFSLEGISELSEESAKKELRWLLSQAKELSGRAASWESLRGRPSAGLFGPSNGGKSTLFNCLLGEEKALVTDEEGTTRDVLEGALPFISLKDTAGFCPPSKPAAASLDAVPAARPGGQTAKSPPFRRPLSEAERLGREKARELFFKVDIPVIVIEAPLFKARREGAPEDLLQEALQSIDGTASALGALPAARPGGGKPSLPPEGFLASGQEAPAQSPPPLPAPLSARALFLQKGLLAITKRDLCPDLKISGGLLPPERVFVLSARERGAEFRRFQKKLQAMAEAKAAPARGAFAMEMGQIQKLHNIMEALQEALKIQQTLKARDLIAQALRRALQSLCEITGEQMEDGVLDQLFKRFCIGK